MWRAIGTWRIPKQTRKRFLLWCILVGKSNIIQTGGVDDVSNRSIAVAVRIFSSSTQAKTNAVATLFPWGLPLWKAYWHSTDASHSEKQRTPVVIHCYSRRGDKHRKHPVPWQPFCVIKMSQPPYLTRPMLLYTHSTCFHTQGTIYLEVIRLVPLTEKKDNLHARALWLNA